SNPPIVPGPMNPNPPYPHGNGNGTVPHGPASSGTGIPRPTTSAILPPSGTGYSAAPKPTGATLSSKHYIYYG
ncbi:MAG: hypothetical protein Q9203_004038, partial [Teloschistes exilis]